MTIVRVRQVFSPVGEVVSSWSALAPGGRALAAKDAAWSGSASDSRSSTAWVTATMVRGVEPGVRVLVLGPGTSVATSRTSSPAPVGPVDGVVDGALEAALVDDEVGRLHGTDLLRLQLDVVGLDAGGREVVDVDVGSTDLLGDVGERVERRHHAGAAGLRVASARGKEAGEQEAPSRTADFFMRTILNKMRIVVNSASPVDALSAGYAGPTRHSDRPARTCR